MVFNGTAGSQIADIGTRIPYSCRFNDDDSAYLDITPSAGNRDIWTMSCWYKPGNLGTAKTFLAAGADTNNYSSLFVFSDDRLYYQHQVGGVTQDKVTSTRVLRDPSAWYHIVYAMDTTAGGAGTLQIYVNGEEVAYTDVNYPAAGVDTDINSATVHTVGKFVGASNYMDGYLAEYHFIDGTKYAASDFGRTSVSTGEWVPKTFAGSYGTNGFYLDFAVAPGTGNGAGTDVSGNANHLTDNGLASNDQVTDTPTNNYCTLNSAQEAASVVGIFADGNLQLSTGSAIHHNRGTIGVSSGKWYFEVEFDTIPASSYVGCGVVKTDLYPMPSDSDFQNTGTYTLVDNGNFSADNGTPAASGTGTFSAGNIAMIAFDAGTGEIWVGKDNVWQGDPAAGTGAKMTATSYEGLAPYVSTFDSASSGVAKCDFGQLGFTYTPPTGFLALNTVNLPTPTILKPNMYFDTVLYTGTGAEHARTDLSFRPDLVWIKQRSLVVTENVLTDSVRGATKELNSDSANDESTVAQGLKSFDVNGFTLGTDNNYNESPDTYAAWCWREGVIPGFDIVSYSGDGGVSQAINHSLGVAPDLMIVKLRDSDNSATARSWLVYHSQNTAAPETDYLVLDTTVATADDLTVWNDTAPTSTQFTVGTDDAVNATSEDYIAYLWASVAGFSKFGSYEANNVANGPCIHCGFKPAWIMVKNFDSGVSGYDWLIWDGKRNTSNPADNTLEANKTLEELDGTDDVDILANGFKLRKGGVGSNGTGTYIYAAFAEAPFKYARAR